jgi:hypothetical protein
MAGMRIARLLVGTIAGLVVGTMFGPACFPQCWYFTAGGGLIGMLMAALLNYIKGPPAR